jgi:hypothetical protein
LFINLESNESIVHFSNNITEAPQINTFFYEYTYNGAGVAVRDLNNDGIPSFKDEAAAYDIHNTNFSIQAAFFYFDRDGGLDMYLMNHNRNKFQISTLAKGST